MIIYDSFIRWRIANIYKANERRKSRQLNLLFLFKWLLDFFTQHVLVQSVLLNIVQQE